MEKRLLVVDPDPANLSFLREKLEASNLRVRTAAGGEEALAALGRESFDLLLCAVEMPRPHGIEVLAEVRKRGLEMPVLFMTRTHDDARLREKLGTLGPADFLERPIFMNRLYERIEFMLQMKFEWRERRMSDRHPVHVDLMLTIRGKTDTVFTVRAKTIDLSLGGLQFERKTCDVCTGYRKGAVHPDCILSRFSIRPDGTPFPVTLQLSAGKPFLVKARVAWTLIQEGTTREFIGLRFEDLAHDERERLRAYLRTARETAKA